MRVLKDGGDIGEVMSEAGEATFITGTRYERFVRDGGWGVGESISVNGMDVLF